MRTNKGITVILLIVIIIGCILIAGIGIYMVTNSNKTTTTSNDNTQQGKSNSATGNNIFETENYALVYDLPEIKTLSGEYWDREEFFDMTNKAILEQAYKKTINSKGGNMQWPEKPDYTMYFKVWSPIIDYNKSKYYIKIDFNEEHAFYPEELGSADPFFNFDILDNKQLFNSCILSFTQDKPASEVVQSYAEEGKECKKLLEDGKWELYSISSKDSDRMLLEAKYYLNNEKTDYINISINLSNQLNTTAINELMQKLKNNFKIEIIEDNALIQYMDAIGESHVADYVKLNSKDEQITIPNGFKLNMKDTNIYKWYCDSGSHSWSFNNAIEWYDSRWKNGLEYISLQEFENTSNKTLEEFSKSKNIKIGTESIVRDGIEIRWAINDMGRKDKVPLDVYLTFKYGDSIYRVEWETKSLTFQDKEITELVQYLFDNIIVIN